MTKRDDDGVVFLATPDAAMQDDGLGPVRERAATALERALGFIEQHAEPFAKHRAYVMLEAEPVESLLERLSALQNADGSFPALGVTASGATGFDVLPHVLPEPVFGSLEALAVLGDARALYAEWVEPLAAYLGEAQREDGSWGSTRGEDDAAEQHIFATGMIAGFLGRTRVVRPHVLTRAGDFLAPLWTPDRVESGHWRERTAFAHYFTNVHHELADEALQWCGREVERDFRTQRCDAVGTLRVLLYCDAQALPGATFDMLELVEGVLAEQGGDGGFAELSGAPAAQRVAPTLDAMLALIRLCRALPSQ